MSGVAEVEFPSPAAPISFHFVTSSTRSTPADKSESRHARCFLIRYNRSAAGPVVCRRPIHLKFSVSPRAARRLPCCHGFVFKEYVLDFRQRRTGATPARWSAGHKASGCARAVDALPCQQGTCTWRYSCRVLRAARERTWYFVGFRGNLHWTSGWWL